MKTLQNILVPFAGQGLVTLMMPTFIGLDHDGVKGFNISFESALLTQLLFIFAYCGWLLFVTRNEHKTAAQSEKEAVALRFRLHLGKWHLARKLVTFYVGCYFIASLIFYGSANILEKSKLPLNCYVLVGISCGTLVALVTWLTTLINDEYLKSRLSATPRAAETKALSN